MSSPTINTDSILIKNVFNKISPKILSPEKNANFCSNNPKEISYETEDGVFKNIVKDLPNLFKKSKCLKKFHLFY